MKTKYLFLAVFVLTGFTALAGFRELHSIKLPFSPSIHYYSHTGDFTFFLCSTKSDILMFDGTTGKTLWQISIPEAFGTKSLANQYWNKDANVILAYDQDSKKGISTKYFIDGKSGKLLWKSDKYVSKFGDYKLSDGFNNNYDPETKGVLLPTENSVEFVDVTNGNVIWKKDFSLEGSKKEFDCFIMSYYDLVKIITGKDNAIFLTTREGKEVSDIEPYFNKKEFLASRKHSSILEIPEKNMYVIMQGETSNLYKFLGADLPKWKMTFIAYNISDDQEIWRKTHPVAHAFDWISYEPFVRLFYSDGKIFVEHGPNVKAETGLSVLDASNGEKLWECYYSTSETKNQGLSKTYQTAFPAPDPVVTEELAYVVDKVKNKVVCYNNDNGTKIWESDKFPDAQKIPSLILTNGVLIMGYGAPSVKNAKIEQSKGQPIYKNEYISKDEYGILAWDAGSGKLLWDSKSISKNVKDKFDYIAGMYLVNGKLYCATNKNFFILDPMNGNIQSNIPIGKEKLGDTWGMVYFAKQNKIILNTEKGIIKIDPERAVIEGTLATPNVAFAPATLYMNADCPYDDYAIFTKGSTEKMSFSEFASVDLNKMQVRGTEDASILFYDNPHFSEGAEMFYKSDKGEVTIYSVK